ncbi:MAG TPA: NAD(P)/FAD-dependent oxidoreductase [Longimicrobiales bacterium]|nr:NAD(P)/FAD-dependent oxidoreductase [Longimicrobiales bacterium]
MTREDADVIIVGAGPAGAVTALLLARAGVDVLLLDRAAFPRAKPCGDCLSSGATAILRRLGVLDLVLARPHARLRGWRIVAPDGNSFEAAFNATDDTAGADSVAAGCALSVERAVLDAVLVEAAIAAGARFERQTVIDVARDAAGAVAGVVTRNGVRFAAITVGADGLRSIVAKRLGTRTSGFLRKLSLTFHAPVANTGNTGEMHVGDGMCAGVAPVEISGLCNLTIVADSARFGRDVARDARAFAQCAIDSLPLLRNRVPAAALHQTPLASGPFDQPVRRVAFDGAVLVGDAAGYYDPFTGQGVYQSLASAELLAPVVAASLRRRDVRAEAFRDYAAGRAALMRWPRLVQYGVETVLRRTASANRAIARIRRAPAFGSAIVSVTGDIAPVRALIAPRALFSLLLPPSHSEKTA